MTQRIFDVDNPQDVKDLFDILPNAVDKKNDTVYTSAYIEFVEKDHAYCDTKGE